MTIHRVNSPLDNVSILQRNVPIPQIPSNCNLNVITALFSLAICSDNKPLVNECLKHFPQSCHIIFQSGETPIHLAFRSSIEMLLYMMKKGVDPNQRNREGETPLCYLMKLNPPINLSVIQMLIINGASLLETDSWGRNCFEILICCSSSLEKRFRAFHVLKLILKNNSKPIFRSDLLTRIKSSMIIPWDWLSKTYFNLLFSSPGFCRDIGDTKRKENFIGEVQGCQSLRRKICEITPLIFSPSVFSQNILINSKLRQTLVFKRFAHALGLENNSASPNLEGFTEAVSTSILASSLNSVLPHHKNFIKEDYIWVYQKVKNAFIADAMEEEDYETLSQVIQKLGYKDALLMGCGHDWHYFSSILFGNFIIIVNKGEDSFDNEEISIYHIPNKLKMSAEYLKRQINRYDSTREKYTNQSLMVKELGLQEIFQLNLKPQKTGNCTYSNTRGAIFVLMAIRGLINYMPKTNLMMLNQEYLMNPKAWESALTSKYRYYKFFTEHDRQQAIIPLLLDVDWILTHPEKDDIERNEQYLNILLTAISSFNDCKASLVKRINVSYRLAIVESALQLAIKILKPSASL